MDATLYEARHAFVWNYGADLVPLLDPQPGEKILDVGCGTGQLTARIAESGAKVLGIDSSPEMIGQARQNYPDLEFGLVDATRFSYSGGFDAAFSNAALHWISEPEKVIENLAASLRPGGRFVAEFGGKRNVEAVLDAARVVLQRRGFEYRNPWYFPSIGEYAGLLENHGFEVGAAWHFDRNTPLDEGEASLADWIEMFGFLVLKAVPKAERSLVVGEMEQILRPILWRDGRWHVDYVRLRLQARLR